MLNDSKVTANIPAADLERARRFYADKLGLKPTDENPGGLIYTTGGTVFFLYETEYADVGAEVKDLQANGVTFEHYDLPGMTWDGDVASMGDMGHAAWFKDSEGNILCIDDLM